MSYKYYNANATGRFVNDCVIRAISVAEGKTWDDTYQELSRIAQKQGILLDDVNFVEPLLDKRYVRERTYFDETVGDFAQDHPRGTYLITMPNHITVLKKGVIYDTFDPSKRILKNAWKVK